MLEEENSSLSKIIDKKDAEISKLGAENKEKDKIIQ